MQVLQNELPNDTCKDPAQFVRYYGVAVSSMSGLMVIFYFLYERYFIAGSAIWALIDRPNLGGTYLSWLANKNDQFVVTHLLPC